MTEFYQVKIAPANEPLTGQWYDINDFYGMDEDEIDSFIKQSLDCENWVFTDNNINADLIDENEKLEQFIELVEYVNQNIEDENMIEALSVYWSWSCNNKISEAIEAHQNTFIGYFEDDDELLETILPDFMTKLDELHTPCKSINARSLIDKEHLIEVMAINAYDIIETGHHKHYVWSKV